MLVAPAWTMQSYRTNHPRDLFPSNPRRPSGRPRVPEGHFDPDELTRRLYVVLAEQKARAERKRSRAEVSSRRDARSASSGTRHRDGAGPAREARPRPPAPPADLVTELRRSESAKRKQAQPAPDDTAAQLDAYHHVPKEAAKQFTRTTTVDNMRNSDLVHKLSKRALKFHTEGPGAARPGGGGGTETEMAPAEFTRVLQRTISQRDQLLERNQFQRTRTLEEAARLDHQQQHHPRSPRKHTFESELARILPGGFWHNHHDQASKPARRNSTGAVTSTTTNNNTTTSTTHPTAARHSLFSPSDPRALALDPLLEDAAAAITATTTQTQQTMTPPLEDLSRFPPADRARVDWSQSDESRAAATAVAPGPKRLLLTPLLRKADSLLMLRGRRGSKDSSSASSGGGGGGGEGGEGGEGTSPTVAKAGKGRFFARFKR